MATTKPKKPITNVQLVTKMMEYSAAGALKQAFIIEAIRKYAAEVQAMQPGSWPMDGFISLDTWKVCATECMDSIMNR